MECLRFIYKLCNLAEKVLGHIIQACGGVEGAAGVLFANSLVDAVGRGCGSHTAVHTANLVLRQQLNGAEHAFNPLLIHVCTSALTLCAWRLWDGEVGVHDEGHGLSE